MENSNAAVADRRELGTSGSVRSIPNKVIDIIVAIGCIVAILICLLPVLNVLAISLSSEMAVINGRVFFWPVEFDLTSYQSVFGDPAMQQCLKVTVGATALSTIYCMVMTVLCAYPLSQNNFVGRKLFNTIIILTMYFSAGMIPDYINIQSLGLLNNFWVLVLPVGISVFNMIILKSFFMGIPESLKESAQLDGASHWRILIQIYLPLSTAALATLTLLYAVGRWNGFQDVRL
jgi:putative aldouronate transport system permease protein